MEIVLLKNDGRCKWLENKVLKKLIPRIINSALDKNQKTMYLIKDWISNDGGKVGVDLKWLDSMGIPVLNSFKESPKSKNFSIVNTGYDSIVDEEKILLEQGIDFVDEPCPYIRRVRKIFEDIDNNYQYVLLCEPNHIIIKNFKTIFPDDMILVQMGNYEERILKQQNGKPIRLVPYVTFLPSHIDKIFTFINEQFPDRANEKFKTSCMWAASPSSPIVEIDKLSEEQLEGIKDALLITTPGSTNKSVISLLETLEKRNLNVVIVSSLSEFRKYEVAHMDSKVLLVRSPIPNKAEEPIMNYIKHGLIKAYFYTMKGFIKQEINRHKTKLALKYAFLKNRA